MSLDHSPENLSKFQSHYLAAMRLGSGRAADDVVQHALDDGITAGDIYLGIFQPTAYAIGQLWQCNQFSVAQEHLATAIIERQMGELHPFFRPQLRKSRTLVIGCVPNEQHRIGARMVADFFEADGWEVHYLGAAVQTSSFLAMAKERQADIIGLSAQMVYHLPHIAEFARGLAHHGLDGIPVIVGGMPFVQQPELAQKLNIQFCATDARAAVHQVNAVFTTAGQGAQLRLPSASSTETLAAFRRARTAIIHGAVASALARHDQVEQFGEAAEQVLTAGFEYTTRMLETAMLLRDTELLNRQLVWASERQIYDAVSPNHLLSRLHMYADVVAQKLPVLHADAVNQYVQWMIARQQEIMTLTNRASL